MCELPFSPEQRLFKNSQGCRGINRADGVLTAISGTRNHTNAGMLPCVLNQLLQQVFPNARHIACNYQIPLRPGMSKGGNDTTQRSRRRIKIADGVQTQVRVSSGSANQHRRPCAGTDLRRDMLHKRPTPERQERFVLAHPGTAASGQNKAGGACAARIHIEDISTRVSVHFPCAATGIIR